MKRKITIIAALLALVFICAAAIEPMQKVVEFKNLQILPKDISEKALQRIMEDEFNKALGVTCDYCHIKIADAADLDYTSDMKGEKQIARSMMRMTMEINQKYFNREQPMIGDSLMTIKCMTCHQGNPYPPEPKH